MRRQWNVRLDEDEWDATEQRRIAAGLSRDEWTRRVFRHARTLPLTPASTHPESTEVLAPTASTTPEPAT